MNVLLPYQVRWVMDRSRVKVAVKSRRIGITWATGYEAVEVAASEAGSDFWYQTYAEDDAKEFINDCSEWARAIDQVFTQEEEILTGDEAHEYFILPAGEESIKLTSIRFTSGYRVTALPHAPRKLRGKGGVYCCDEGAVHDNLEAIIKAAMAFQVWGGRLIFISTVTDEDNEFTKLYRRIEAGKFEASLHLITLVDAYREGLYKRVCAKIRHRTRGREGQWSQEAEDHELARLLATPGADQEFLCIPLRSGGLYLPPGLTEPCMTLPQERMLRLEKDDDFLFKLTEEEREQYIAAWLAANVAPQIEKMSKTRPSYFGQDFGRSGDLSVLAPGQLMQDLKLEVPFMLELHNIPYECQKQITAYVLDELPLMSFAAIDSVGNGAYLGEFAVAHYGEERAEMVRTQLPWYGENFPKLRARFEEQTIVLPKDVDVRQDLTMVERIDGIPRLPKQKLTSKRDKKIKRHGDAAIALVMLNYAAGHPGLAYKYEKVSKRGGHFAFEGLL